MTPRVAVLGAGNMAGAMVGTLRRAGSDVTLWNRTAERAEAVAEARSDDGIDHGGGRRRSRRRAEQSRRRRGGARDLPRRVERERVRPRPRRARDEHDRAGYRLARRRGRGRDRAAFLDAPVSGSVPTVEKGELTIMVGGDPEALERARPVLDTLAAKIFHVGTLGAGATVKLAVNALVHAIDVGLSKRWSWRRRPASTGAPTTSSQPELPRRRSCCTSARRSKIRTTRTSRSRSTSCAKDLELILSLAREVGAPMEQAQRNRELVERAIVGGFSGRDLSAIAEYFRGSG